MRLYEASVGGDIGARFIEHLHDLVEIRSNNRKHVGDPQRPISHCSCETKYFPKLSRGFASVAAPKDEEGSFPPLQYRSLLAQGASGSVKHLEQSRVKDLPR